MKPGEYKHVSILSDNLSDHLSSFVIAVVKYVTNDLDAEYIEKAGDGCASMMLDTFTISDFYRLLDKLSIATLERYRLWSMFTVGNS